MNRSPVLRITALNWFEMTFFDDPTNTVWAWNVDRALGVVRGRPVERVSVAEVRHFAETYEVSREYALSDRVDVSRPLLFVLLAGRITARAEVKESGLPEAVLIDGVHRLTKAIHFGLRALPAWFLEADEEPLVRLTAEMLERLRTERALLEEASLRKAG